MPILDIQGHKVQVDDSFLKLSPEQQNATVDEIAHSLGVKPTAAPSQAATAGPWTKYQKPALPQHNIFDQFDAKPAKPQGNIFDQFDAKPTVPGPWTKYAHEPAEQPTTWDHVKSVLSEMFPQYGPASAIANGMTFGTLPNIEAAANAGLHGAEGALGYGDGRTMGQVYDDTLKYAQDKRRQFEQDHPLVNTAANVAGGVATGTGLAKNGVTLVGREVSPLVQRIFAGSTVLPKMAAGAVEGGAYSAAGGFGGGEGDFSQRLDNARKNLPFGMALGAAAPAVVDYVGKPAAGFAGRLYRSYVDPVAGGKDALVTAIMRDKLSPNSLAQKVEEAQAAGQPDFRAIDAAGYNTQRLGKLAARTPGEFRDQAAHVLDARQAGQVDRLKSYIDQATGSNGPNAREIERGITAGRATAAQPLYDRAYATPAPRGRFYNEMLQRRSVQDAMRGVEKMAAENQVPLTDLFTEIPTPPELQVTKQVPSNVLGADGQPVMQTVVENPTKQIPTMRGWDMIKRNLDAQVDAGYRSSDAQSRAAASAIKQTRDALVKQLRTDNPAYGAALGRYSNDSAALDAVDTGRQFARAPSDATREAFDAVPEGQRDLARVGASAEIRNKLDRQRSGQDATLLFDRNSMRDVLDRVATDPVARAALGNPGTSMTRTGQLGNEQAMAATRRLFGGGSDTAENLLEQTPPGLAYALSRVFSRHPLQGLGLVGEVAGRAVSGMSEPAAKAIGDVLMSNEPDKIRSLADLFKAAQHRAAQPSIAPAVIAAGFGAPRQRRQYQEAGWRR